MSKARMTFSSVVVIIIMMQLTTMLRRMMKSNHWLLITWMHIFLTGFQGLKMNRALVAVNLNIVNFENFFAMATNDYKEQGENLLV